MTRRAEIEASLFAARERTLALLNAVPDAALNVRVHEFYSPLGWHFGHIGRTEVYWTTEAPLGLPAVSDDPLSLLFANVPDNPKENRTNLPARAQIVAYLHRTRELTLAALRDADLDSFNPLLADGYAYEFALRHEYQHQETIAELRQLIAKASLPPGEQAVSSVPHAPPTPMIALPGGTFLLGSADPHGYDNEKDPHPVTVAPFALDETPVTNAQWLTFVAAGGYETPRFWNEAGWEWRTENAVTHPEYWHPAGADGFHLIGANGARPFAPDEPVCGVSWYEADAYARWAGKRLPTEAEWEYAAAFDPATGTMRAYPSGDTPPTPMQADLDLAAAHPSPVGARPAGRSALGLLYMAGGVWEWTTSPFLPYPGFAAFPYNGYSLDSMDGRHLVCRGGSWATGTPNGRAAFRNFYVPGYRQGFLGVRCAG